MMTTEVLASPPATLIKRLDELDFTPVLRTLVQDSGFDQTTAQDLTIAFKQWFSVIPQVAARQVYVMLKTPVDDVFHACVLNTAFYRELCSTIIGEFVDHTPIDPETIQELDSAVIYTVKLLEVTFGDMLHPALKDWRRLLDSGTYVVSCVQCNHDMGETVVGRLQNGVRLVH
ncbi:MAG TPA: hypothetical protein VFT87_00845 [Candidatus Saccharimonadales bacterium]|nr:hypothetical protein [Candidatus Saccharimonadales bacterium]